MQHVVSLLQVDGTAALVVPDNVLFEAGACATIRRRLLHDCDVHTLLRLPTGIFYAQGAKANLSSLRRREGAEAAWTRELWVYDLCTHKQLTRKQNPLCRADLADDLQDTDCPPELRRLGRNLICWHAPIVNWHRVRVSKGPTATPTWKRPRQSHSGSAGPCGTCRRSGSSVPPTAA